MLLIGENVPFGTLDTLTLRPGPSATPPFAPIVIENEIAIPAGPECPGDADGDLDVDIADLNLLLANFDSAVAPGTNGDVDGSGFVDIADLNEVLANFNTNCLPA